MKHLIFDTHNMLHRCRVASFGQSDGEFVLVYNFFLFLRPIVEKWNPDFVWFGLEGHPQFRHDLFAGYKANRIEKYSSDKSLYQDINRQKNIILNTLKYLPIQTILNPHVECDDVIGTLCNNIQGEKIVVSSDNDYIQLLQKFSDVKVYDPKKKECMTAPNYHFLLFKTLNGDVSDNIPKILSPKKANDIASSSEKLEVWLAQASPEQLQMFNRNRQLVEFSIESNFDNCKIEKYSLNEPLLQEAWREMKFESLLTDKAWPRYLNTFKNVKPYN